MKSKYLVIWVSLIFIICLGCRGEELLVFDNGGFERMEPTSNDFPTTLNQWSGDLSQIHLSPHNGITPRTGKGMLQFIKSVPMPGPGGAPEFSSQLFQLIDLRKVASKAEKNGVLRVTLEGYFNRVKGNADTDTSFVIGLYVFDIEPKEFPEAMKKFRYIASATRELFSDSDPATWEKLTISLRLPRKSTLLAVAVMANENVVNNVGSEPEFDGHYVDDVSLQATVTPN